MFEVPEEYRLQDAPAPYSSDPSFGNNGVFVVDELRVIASDGGGWEHVSVSREDRIPSWEEMSRVKDLFWGNEDFVVQMHPPKSDYVNNHPRCLHLWRKSGTNDFCERPPSIFVGPKATNDDN